MVAYVPLLEDADVVKVAADRHATWGAGRSQREYTTFVQACVERSEGRVQLAALRDGGEILCSLERHRLSLASPEGHLDAVGIGGLFTPASRRGEGHARSLIERVVHDARAEGASACLVFSDVSPSFYEKLGFTTLSHVSWTARVDALPNQPARIEPTADLARLTEIFEASWRPGWLRARRTVAGLRYAAWRRDATDAFLLGEHDYVVTRRVRDTLWIEDAATTEVSRDELWAGLRTLAMATGAAYVSGWLRPEHAGGPFVASPRTSCIPMIATELALDDARSHFASLDQI